MMDQIDKLEVKIDNRFDKLDDRLKDIHKTLSANTESLIKHELRTSLAEENLDQLRIQIKPIKKHVDFINTGAKIVVLLGGFLLFLKQLDFLDNIIHFLFNR